ncbi:MAG: 30S ribosomal protein S6 [Candidatus Binatia bacterium]
MTLYETLFVVHPEKGLRMKEFVERFKKVIEGQEGTMSQVDEWGARDLAYKIEKQSRGYYTLLRYRATGRAVEELERNLKMTDGILRYLTVRCDDETAITNPAAPRPHIDEPRQSPEREAAKVEPQAKVEPPE